MDYIYVGSEQQHDIYKFSSSDLQIQEIQLFGNKRASSSRSKKVCITASHSYEINYGNNSNFLERRHFQCIYVFVAGDWSDTHVGNPQKEGLAHVEPKELASWEGFCLMCRRQNVLLTLQGEATGDRDQHAVSHSPPQGTLCSPFSRSGKYEIVLQEEDYRGLKTQSFAPWEPFGMLTTQDLKESSVLMSYRIHVKVNVTL